MKDFYLEELQTKKEIFETTIRVLNKIKALPARQTGCQHFLINSSIFLAEEGIKLADQKIEDYKRPK